MPRFTLQKKADVQQFVQPINIFAKSIIFRSRFSQVVHVLISVAFVVRGLFGLNVLLTGSKSATDSQPSIFKYLLMWRMIYSFIFALNLVHFATKAHLYERFFKDWREIVHQNPLIANNCIIKNRKKLTIIIITLFVYELVTITYDIIKLQDSNLSTELDITKLLLQYSFAAVISAGWTAFIHCIVESSIYIQSTFKVINYYLKNFDLIKLFPSKLNASHKIRSIRKLYAQSIELVNLIDTFLSLGVFGFYIYFIGYCLFIFSILFYPTTSRIDLIMSILRCIGESNYIIIVTYYLVHIHSQSTQIFEKVYDLTLTKPSDYEYTNEIHLFLVRVDQQDVGFKFARLFVIKPSFVSSVATVTLTLALTMPNLF